MIQRILFLIILAITTSCATDGTQKAGESSEVEPTPSQTPKKDHHSTTYEERMMNTYR